MNKYKTKISIVRPNMSLRETVATIDADNIVSAIIELLQHHKDRGIVMSIAVKNETLKKSRDKFLREDYH